jgi:hypothetical protein
MEITTTNGIDRTIIIARTTSTVRLRGVGRSLFRRRPPPPRPGPNSHITSPTRGFLTSADRRKPNSMFPTRCPWERLWRNASRVRSPIASRSHWDTAPMIVMTRRPAADPVSSASATEIRATLRFSNSSSRPHRSFTLRVSRSSLAF